MKSTLLATSALTATGVEPATAGFLHRRRRFGAAGALSVTLVTTLAAMSAAMLPACGATAPLPDGGAAIFGDEGGDEFGEVGENGDYLVPPETGERGDIGEQGEYSDGEYGERGEAGWNRPRDDNEGESDDLLEGLGSGGQGSAPGPGGGSPLLEGLGEGGSSGGLLD